MNVKMRNIKNIKKTMQIKDLRVPKSKISSMWKDEDALATFGNLCMPMGWMTCGWGLEALTGCIFGNWGKLLLLCFPA